MKAKYVVTSVLLAFVGVSLVYAGVQESRRHAAESTPEPAAPNATPATAQTTAPQTETPDRRVIVYYFRGNQRCPSCLKIEAYTKASVEENFAEGLTSGDLEWQMVNVDEPGNGHYAEDYGLYTKSVVLVEKEGDKQLRWKNLDRIWNLLQDEELFKTYIREEIEAFQKGEAAA